MTSSRVRVAVRPSVLSAVIAMTLLWVIFAAAAHAQAVAETAGTTSVSAAATNSVKPVQIPKFPASANGAAASQHLIVSSGPPPQETNVREFLAGAGRDAGKVLLRAAPVAADVWVNGKIIGKTPMLLVLAPGKYQVEMRGAKGETGQSIVDLLPHETRELTVKLRQLYPGRVTVQR